MKDPLLSAVIVNWNAGDLLLRAIESLLNNGLEPPPEVVVIDNASTDGSPQRAGEAFPGVRVFIMPENRGYGAGANAGVARTRAPFVVVMNPDVEVLPGSLAAWVEFLQTHPRAGMCGGVILSPEGRLQLSHLRVPSVWSEAWMKVVGNRLPAWLWERWLRKVYRRARQLPVVGGCIFCFRRRALEMVEGFDEGFFLYFEEADICQRLWKQGWEVWLVPRARVVHHGARSTSQNPLMARSQGRQSRLRFYRKHRPLWEQGLVRLL